MEAPLCKLCGERHWGSVCPKFTKQRAAAMAQARAQEIAARPVKKGKKAKKKRGKANAKHGEPAKA